MLIQFSVKNFRSFKEEATLSMVASSIKELKIENTFQSLKNLSVLKSTVVYGANASGKSNLFRAMNFMKMFIYNSSKETQASEPIPVERFKLNSETENDPSSFEIIFIHNEIRYRYGFAVTNKEVVEEWLYYIPKSHELEVFVRQNQDFKLSIHFKSGESLVKEKLIRPNALLLSVSAQFNGDIARAILEWFSNFNCISGDSSKNYEPIALELSKEASGRESVLNFLKKADLGIDNFNIVEKRLAEPIVPLEFQQFVKNKPNITQINVKTSHLKYDSKGNIVGAVEFDMNNEESNGTQKIFQLSGAFIDTLRTGKVLVIDELDARIHPNLIRAIFELFNSKEFNLHNAQLIIASHNTSILDKDFLRRDQIWFTQKDQFGASELFSLVEFRDPVYGKKIRNDASYEKSYLNGIYGAVPHVRDFEVTNGNR